MALTLAQLQSFKTAINADATAAATVAAKNTGQVADYFNTVPGTPTSIWRPVLQVKELNTAIDWSAFAGLTVAKQNAYFAMTQGGFVDATGTNIRNGFVAVFGAGSASTTALTALAQQGATRFEALFVASGVSAVFGYRVNEGDVLQALAS